MADLNALVPLPLGITLTNAVAVNDSGQILANGRDIQGQDVAFLLTPDGVNAPEPSVLAMAVLIFAGLGIERVFRRLATPVGYPKDLS
jgi:hypothetical protein